jgi:hypothetical protein
MEFSHAISPHGESFIGHNLYYNTDRQVLQGDMRKKIVLREKRGYFCGGEWIALPRGHIQIGVIRN